MAISRTNRLSFESSPYLQQHAGNPVDWYPWGTEAIDRARRLERPIFLSIGYSACHWCHVMEHESFQDERIAAFLNEHFVAIKVDREERPDLDQIYMQAVQILTGRGGWPMSVFLTPELQPFFGGTYWPPQASRGMPGFDQVLAAVLEAWNARRTQAIEQARLLTERISQSSSHAGGSPSVSLVDLEQGIDQLLADFDPVDGGFGAAPKFPHSMALQFLLRMADRHEQRVDWIEPACRTLDKMACDGIYDHLAGGFARYSVDAQWLVPHFEKMLYDNGLLADAYLDAYQLTQSPRYAQVAQEIGDYVLNTMLDPLGGFHSTEDADSEGVEGKFYVWRQAEIDQILGRERSELFCRVYGVSSAGNFEGANILHLSAPLRHSDPRSYSLTPDELEDLSSARRQLLEVRDQRVRPHKDDKVLTSWNGLMIHALARMGAILDQPRFTQGATRAAEFLWQHLRLSLRSSTAESVHAEPRLLHSWRKGTAKLGAYLDDYANFANALITLYEVTLESPWIEWADELTHEMRRHFSAPDGGFYFTADTHEQLIARTKELQDNATPSGNSMAAMVLLRLGHLTQRSEYIDQARTILQLAAPWLSRYPLGFSQMLIAAEFELGPVRQFVFVADANVWPQIDRAWHSRWRPRSVRVRPDPRLPACLHPLVVGKNGDAAQPKMYICTHGTCHSPVEGLDAILNHLNSQ